ncbi:autotransporter assembly complex protein TamA [Acinetobacter sp. KS-LM10]|uniref:autotransporter assembly complex protein TamA n=1 Tax=Acinetobacter sp. KS-LM10 TaxID=3120518 RepID=UPI0030D17D83
MSEKNQFKKSVLAHCMHSIFNTNDINKLLYASVFLSVFNSPLLYAAEKVDTSSAVIKPSNTENDIKQNKQALEAAAKQQGLAPSKIEQLDEKLNTLNDEKEFNSLEMLQNQESAIDEKAFIPIEFEDLEDLPVQNVNNSMANEILQVAEEAKVEAQNFRSGVSKAPAIEVLQTTGSDLKEITQAPINIDALMKSIEEDSKIVVQENEAGRSLASQNIEQQEEVKKQNVFKRIFYKIRPPRTNQVDKIPRITAQVEGAPKILADNIKAKLSAFTSESFSDYNAALPQLRTLAQQAAQAVGYYDAEFKFEKASANQVRVLVTPNKPVLVREQNIEFSGAGKNLAQFQVIGVLPELEEGDVLNHAKYEVTKNRIAEAASNNGFFDSYWRMHDVMLARPQNLADINLSYETGERYKLGEVEFRMSDPSKPLPLREDILRILAPWKAGADYTAWRVNLLANNLTNSRYFNYTLVDAVKPDPIIKPLELAPDLQRLVDEQNIPESQFRPDLAKEPELSAEVESQSVADENQFAGVKEGNVDANLTESERKAKEREKENDRLQTQAREEKVIPVIVTLNADRLNTIEAGLGYGTDTGVRLRSQYRRAIVNEHGHSFDANLELSQIRQSIDGRYNVPYKHPLNDYVSFVGGYEREDRDSLGNGLDLVVESAVAGVDRVIKGGRRDWQHIFGLRYRLDRMTIKGELDLDLNEDFNIDDIPDSFLATGNTEQQSLLLGYDATKIISDQRINPTKGFKQNYKIQLGSKSLLSDVDMAITNANWKAMYSLGENSDHQFIGGASLGYIFTDNFEKVPYNLRFFAGGDQSLRGFDYKSLSPTDFGFKIGGQALAVGTVEYNYQFKEGWRAAVFSDFGNAYDEKFSNPTEYSLGLGIRWNSPIGPIRLDVASGISDPGKPIRLHFFIGSQL